MPPQFASAVLALQFVGFAATKAKSSSGSSSIFLILLLIAFGAYFFIRPQRKRLRQQQADQRSVDVGDEVVTASGIVGRIKSFNGDRADLEIAPGTTIEVLRQAISRRATPAMPEEPDYSSHEDNAEFGADDHDASSGAADKVDGDDHTPGGSA